MKEFENCIINNKIGVEEFVKEYETNISKSEYSKCTKSCIENKSDINISFAKCLDKYIDNLNQKFDITEEKIDLFRKSL